MRAVTQANREAVLGSVGTVPAAPAGTPGEESDLEWVIAASTIRKKEPVLECCFAAYGNVWYIWDGTKIENEAGKVRNYLKGS